MHKQLNELKVLRKGENGLGILIETDAGHISPQDPRNANFINEIKQIEGGKVIISEPLHVYVVLQKFGVLNRNGRIYPESVLRRQDEIYQQYIKERRAFGELNHPESSVISGDRISHNILKTWWEGHTLMGTMEILMSPGFINHGIVSTRGDDVANLLRNKIMIGVSSRGVGSLKEVDGKQIVQDDFEMICWDIVTAPSTPGSWMSQNPNELKPFIENEIKGGSLLKENLDKFLLD